jgi:integrase/recombinase XerD
LYLFEDFIAFLRVERALAENSIQAYRRDLEELALWLSDDAMKPSEITVFQLRDFLRMLAASRKATATISRKLSSIRVYFAFLRREGKIPANIAKALTVPSKSNKLPEVLSRTEVEKLLAQPDSETAAGLRDLTLLELLYSCGLRVSEALEMTFDSLNLEDEFVRIRGKGDKERLVPFGRSAHDLLLRYIEFGRLELSSRAVIEPHIFLNRRGGPLSRVSAWKMIKKYWLQAGGVRPISPHTLRHSFATHLIDSGADIRFVQELLGHSDVSTTEKYTHISKEHLRREFLRFHPRGR